MSRLGETQADVDLILELPTTGERAFVQVKSTILGDYVDRYQTSGAFDRMFFVCHSFSGKAPAVDSDKLHLITGHQLAQMAIKVGLYEWLVERSS